jgi:hypothetical protein
MRYQSLLICILCVFSLLFCKKKNETINPNTAELLTGVAEKIWYLTDVTQNNKSILSPCAADDTFTFAQNPKTCTYRPNKPCYDTDTLAKYQYSINIQLQNLVINQTNYHINKITQTQLILQYEPNEQGARLASSQKTLHHPQILYFISK